MRRIHHIGIAVKNLEDAIKIYQDILGDLEVHEEEVPEQKVKVKAFPLRESRIELLEPTSPESPIAKYMEKRGEGIHHIAFEVEDILETLKSLKEKGYRLIDEKPRQGAMGMQIAFVHPKSTRGVLIEICQTAK